MSSGVGAIAVFGTTFQNPVLLAAGTAGFGREVADVIELDRLGGIITKAVSPEPRAGHAAPRVAEFDGGMVNAVGLANPGLDHVAEVALPWLARHLTRARVLVNVVGGEVTDFVTVVQLLGERDVVVAFELNVSCPNTGRGNQEFSADHAVLRELVRRCRDVTDKPLIVKLPPNLPDVAATAAAAASAGASGFSLVNTMPGLLFREDRANGTGGAPRLGFGAGGVSGPGLLPVGVLATRRVHERTGLPVIGVGGIKRFTDARQYLVAGATLVAIGTAALADPRVPEWVAADWRRHG